MRIRRARFAVDRRAPSSMTRRRPRRVYNWLRVRARGRRHGHRGAVTVPGHAASRACRAGPCAASMPHLWDSALAFVLCAAGFVYRARRAEPVAGLHGLDAVGAVLLLAMTLPLVAVRSHPRVGLRDHRRRLDARRRLRPSRRINVGYWCGAIALFFVASRSDIWRSLLAGMLASVILIVIFAILLVRGSVSLWLAARLVVRLLGGVAGRRRPARLPRERARGPGARPRRARARRPLPARPRDARPGGGRPRTQPPGPRAARRGRPRPERRRTAGRRGAARLRQAGRRRCASRSASIEATGRQALGDIERLLGILRAEAGDREELGPQPGLADMPGLVAQVREAGVAVAVDERLQPTSTCRRASIARATGSCRKR